MQKSPAACCCPGPNPGGVFSSCLFCPWETESQDRACGPQPCVMLVTADCDLAAAAHPSACPPGREAVPQGRQSRTGAVPLLSLLPGLGQLRSLQEAKDVGCSDFRLLGSRGKSGPASDGAEGRLWWPPRDRAGWESAAPEGSRTIWPQREEGKLEPRVGVVPRDRSRCWLPCALAASSPLTPVF